MQGTVFDIKKFAIHDGPGIRTTVFLKGCPLDCWWCHNPEGRHPESETADVKKETAASAPEIQVGMPMTVAELMTEIEKDILFYDESNGGVTFSGGEPLMQPDFLAALLTRCRRQGIHTALDTTGYALPEIMARISPLVDLFLYDLKFMDDLRHQKYTGVPNGRILANLRYLVKTGRSVRVRFPMIPRINDTADNLDAMSIFLREMGLKQIDLLPYHRIHRQKYHRLGQPDRLADITSPQESRIERTRTYFESCGMTVKVGG